MFKHTSLAVLVGAACLSNVAMADECFSTAAMRSVEGRKNL